MSLWSGSPQTWITTGAPGFATRPASRSAATMSVAKKNELKPVTRSKLSSAKGSDSISPTSSSALREPAVGDLDQRLGGIEPGDARAAVGGEAQEGAGAAADVEHAVAGSSPTRASAAS